MNVYKKLFSQTLIYGVAAVFPKVIGFIMVPLHIEWMKDESVYGSYSVLFTWMMLFNALLSFGMETAFFRFYNKLENQTKVKNNSILFICGLTAIFGVATLTNVNSIASIFDLNPLIVSYLIWILIFDALVVIPFAILRANEKSFQYSLIRIINVLINAGLTVVFLYLLPKYISENPNSTIQSWFKNDFQVGYVFLSNLAASLVTFLLVSKNYINIRWKFDWKLNKEMMKYAFPVMIASLAFAVNEGIDRVLIEHLLPEGIGEAEAGRYSACYKMGIFMVLFRMAYSLGIEPFFFNYAKNEDAQLKYATVTKYFIIFGSFAMLGIIVFVDVLKPLLIPKSIYWSAMEIVPYIILANFMLGIYTNLSVWYKLQDKTYIGAIISLIGAVATIGFNYLLIPRTGIIGAAITSLIAYSLMLLISYILGQKAYPIPYDKKAIAIYLTTSTIFSFGYFYNFRENYFIGIALILIFVGLIYFNEKIMIQRIIKSFLKK